MAEYEDRYYGQMPTQVADLVDLRKEGWKKRGAGDLQAAVVDLTESAEGLAELFPTFVEYQEGKVAQHPQIYARESLASSGQLAITLCQSRLWLPAEDWAHRAFNTKRAVLLEDGVPRSLFIDQYAIIFSGRLSTILSTSRDPLRRFEGREWAGLAAETYKHSEDLRVVRFPDNDMTPEQRTATVSKFGKAAKAANIAAMPFVPRPIRKAIAKEVCSR